MKKKDFIKYFFSSPVNSYWQKKVSQLFINQQSRQKYLTMLEKNTSKDTNFRIAYALSGAELFEEAYLYYLKFEKSSTIISWWQEIRFAEILCHMGKNKEAYLLIEQIYQTHPNARNGWTSIAWILIKNNIDKAHQLILRDAHEKRISPEGSFRWAALEYYLGNHDNANKIIKNAYEKDSRIINGFSYIFWFMREQDPFYRDYNIIEGDIKFKRFIIEKQYGLLKVLAKNQEFNHIIRFINYSYAHHSRLQDLYINVAWDNRRLWSTEDIFLFAKLDFDGNHLSKKGLLLFEKACLWCDQTKHLSQTPPLSLHRKIYFEKMILQFQKSFQFCDAFIKTKRLEYSCHKEKWLTQNKNKFKDQTCFIIGNGPGLKKIPESLLNKYPSFGTNGIFLTFTPTFYVTISREFFHNHPQKIIDLNCKRKFIRSNFSTLFTGSNNESSINCIPNIPCSSFLGNFPMPYKFSKNANCGVFIGGSVIFVCLQLAYWLGFKKIILLGIDHDFKIDRKQLKYNGTRLQVREKDDIHFSENYLKPFQSVHCDILAIERGFKLAIEAFQSQGRSIVNASPDSKLTIIPKIDIKDI